MHHSLCQLHPTRDVSACTLACLISFFVSFYSLTDSSVETADQIVTLLNDGIFGSWLTSSKIDIEFAALTPMESFVSFNILMASFTILRMFRGVMLLSTTCCRVPRALLTLSSFSILFFSRFSAAVDILLASPKDNQPTIIEFFNHSLKYLDSSFGVV